MDIHGRCHCGKITYEAKIDPDHVGICHCTDCQTMSGAPYRVNVPVRAADFTLHGTPAEYIKMPDSGKPRIQAFCPTCGTALYAVSVDDRSSYNLRLGAILERAELPPRRRKWCRSALPWSENIEALPQSEKQT